MRVLDADAAFQNARIETKLELFAALGLESRVAVRTCDERWLVAVTNRGFVQTARRERIRLLACRTPRAAHAELLHECQRPELFFREHPGRAQLRVDGRIEIDAECAVV